MSDTAAGGWSIAPVRTSVDTVQRYVGLELCRFVCAVSIVIFHYQHFFFTGLWQEMPGAFKKTFPLYSVLAPVYISGWVGVYVFWCVSGFIFFWKYAAAVHEGSTTPREFFFLRFSRLYPLSVLMLCVTACLQALYSAGHHQTFIFGNNDVGQFLLQLLMASNWLASQPYSFDAPIWSVSAEVLTYAIFFAILRRFAPSARLCLVVIVGSAAILAIGYQPAVHCTQIFFAGGLIQIATAGLSRRAARRAFFVVLPLAFLCLLFVVLEKNAPRALLLPIASLCVAACVLGEPLVERWATALERLGNLTYGSYLLHFPIQLAIVLVLDAAAIDRRVLLSPLALAGFLAATFAAAHVAFMTFERPMQAFVRRRALTIHSRATAAR